MDTETCTSCGHRNSSAVPTLRWLAQCVRDHRFHPRTAFRCACNYGACYDFDGCSCSDPVHTIPSQRSGSAAA